MANQTTINALPSWIQEKQWFSNRLIWHLAFWVARLFIIGWLFSLEGRRSRSPFFMELFDLPAEMITVYICLYVLLPYFLFKNRYIGFFLLFTATLYLGGLLKTATVIEVYYPFMDIEIGPRNFYQYTFSNISFAVIFMSPVIFAAVAIKLIKQWYQSQISLESLKKEKLEAELKFLKAQVHPHFLFNTLNSIYGLALKKSNNTPDIVLKLSGLLNYMLYEGRAKWVDLDKELSYVEDYIALEQMRYGERLNVSLQVTGEPHKWVIAPMLILSFIENCFKHGASVQTDQAWIKINVEVGQEALVFDITNSKADIPTHNNGKDVSESYKAGIGLDNVKRRLDLIYGDAYSLKIDEQKDNFSVVLYLSLNPQTLITEDLVV